MQAKMVRRRRFLVDRGFGLTQGDETDKLRRLPQQRRKDAEY